MLRKRVKEIVRKAADNLGISHEDAMIAYRGYWLFIKQIIEDMPLDDASEEEFEEMRTSINVTGLGKFHTNYERVQRIKKSNAIINERTSNKRGKTSS